MDYPAGQESRDELRIAMETIIALLPVTPSIEQLGRIIGNVAAPAFLLGAVAAFISVVISRINRVIRRRRGQ